MKALNSSTRTNAIFYAVLWTFIPMLLAASGVLFHFTIKQKESSLLRSELSKLKAQQAELGDRMQQFSTIDSLMRVFSASEEKYHQAMKGTSSEEPNLLSEVQSKERLLQMKIDQSRRLIKDTTNAVFCMAMADQFQNMLNHKKQVRESWKKEVPPSSCPEMELRMEQLEADKEAMYEKLLNCQFEKIQLSSSSAYSSSKNNSIQGEKLFCEKEKTALLKEVEKHQNSYADLVANIKEVISDNSPSTKKRDRLSNCEDKIKSLESIVKANTKASVNTRVNLKN